MLLAISLRPGLFISPTFCYKFEKVTKSSTWCHLLNSEDIRVITTACGGTTHGHSSMAPAPRAGHAVLCYSFPFFNHYFWFCWLTCEKQLNCRYVLFLHTLLIPSNATQESTQNKLFGIGPHTQLCCSTHKRGPKYTLQL